jgi:guanylate kinase
LNLNKIIIITAPSGSGKTTLVKRLVTRCAQLEFSVSACTRAPRPGEVDGKDYYFYAPEQFKKLVDAGAFVEYEMVYTGKYYGTLRSELQRIWDDKKYPLLEIDVRGAMDVKAKYADTTLTVFIEPPSIEVLRDRLTKRGSETADAIEERIQKAIYELGSKDKFDTIIINDDLDIATEELVRTVEEFLKN